MMSDLETALEDCQQELETAQDRIETLAAEVERLAAENSALRAQLEESLRCDRIHTSDYETTARQLRDCRDDLKTVIDRAEDTTRWLFKQTADNAALRAQLDAEGWRPVSEAPEKKGYYLGWRGNRVVWAGYWPGEYYPDSSPWVDEVGLDIAITHWRPLPAPPQE